MRKERSSVFYLALGLVLILLAVGIAAGCAKKEEPKPAPAPAAPTPAPAAQTKAPEAPKKPLEGKKVRIGFSSLPDFINVVGYKAVDIMKEWGAEVIRNDFDGVSILFQAVMAGEIDIAEASGGGGYPLVYKDTGLMIFASHDRRPNYVLVTKGDVKTTQDLKGKRFAQSGTTGITVLLSKMWLEKNGVDSKDVEMVVVGSSGARAQALAAGQVDASLLRQDQYEWLAAEKGEFNNLANLGLEFPQVYEDFWWASKTWLEKNGDLAVAWNKALIQAARWANSNKQAVIEFGQTKVPGITADKAWGLYDYYIKLGMWPVNGGMSKELVYGDHELWAKSKDMAPMPYEKWGTNEFQDKALAEIGKQ